MQMNQRTFGTRREEVQKRDAEGIKNGGCSLLDGSAWSTYKGTFESFFGVEHRMVKEDMLEQFNKEAKQGWRLAVDAARVTDEKASSEDREHTSGGLFVGIDSNLGAVVGNAEGSVTWTPGNEGILDQAWVNARGGMRVLSVYFLFSEGWTPRNEAFMRQLRSK